jgi:hypothetical protein
MTFDDLQKEIGQYVYTEDNGMGCVSICQNIGTRLQKFDPIWLILIGASSSGKSQILRPLALTDTKFIHRVDDMTDNTLLSGIRVAKGQKDISLLKRIGKLGIIIISDLTVIFSRNSESKGTILGQLRMVYDGFMTKYSGTSAEPITWKGHIGILAGSTPSIYGHFEEVADMGERFLYYRMKNFDVEKATRLSMDRKLYGEKLDEKLSELYGEYIKSVVLKVKDLEIPQISEKVHERVLQIAMFGAKLRTPVHFDKFSKTIDRVPVSEMPMRVVLQLKGLIMSMMCMSYHDTDSWELSEEQIGYIEWCAYSLANEERRACLRVLAELPFDAVIRTQTVADKIGLSTTVIGTVLQHLSAIGIVQRTGSEGSLTWGIKEQKVWEIIRRLEGITLFVEVGIERDVAVEEVEEAQTVAQQALENF